jgi:hypothetical protein
MRNWKQLALTAVLISVAPLLGPSITDAQRGVLTSRPVAVGSHRTSGPARSGAARSSFSGYSLGNGEGIFPGIGLGLGYGYYPGNQGLINAAINPATQLQLAVAGRLLRDHRGLFGYGGYYLLDGGQAYAIPTDESAPNPEPQPSQQVIVMQQAPAQSPSDSQSAAAIPDEGEFTLVLHNGKSVQAVAFTRMKERIIYIATDGSRHTIAAEDLDPDATIRVNEERGTPLQMPL